MSSIIVIGAGPAGMATAMELSKAGTKCLVIEKSAQVGGLAKTLHFHEPEGLYRTDIGPHRFYSKNKYLYDFIEDLLQEQWREVPRQTRFYVDGSYYNYPIQLQSTLKKMGLFKAARVLADYMYERVRSKVYPRTIRNFEDYAVANFGRTLAEFNMLNYTEKIWGIPCKHISADWAQQRIGGLSLLQTLKKALFNTSNAKSLVDSFYYPQYGSGTTYEAILQQIQNAGSSVQCEAEPTEVIIHNSHVVSIAITHNNEVQTHEVSQLVSSMPLNEFITLCGSAVPAEVVHAANQMKFRAQRYLFITINKDSVTNDNWLYYPDKEIPFGRISEMKNFSTDMSPAGKTSLMIEFFCSTDEAIWHMPTADLYDTTVEWLEELALLEREYILNHYEYKIEHVYPIYDLQYKENVDVVMNWCNTIDNLQLVGRPGRFRYNNQDHSLEMGIMAAQTILDGKKRDIENIGSEKEYFERGYVPIKKSDS